MELQEFIDLLSSQEEKNIPTEDQVVNIYKFSFACVCPNNGEVIGYYLTVKSKNTIFAEDIVAACKKHKSQFHEVIADQLHQELGGYQEIQARHDGVLIKTMRGSL